MHPDIAEACAGMGPPEKLIGVWIITRGKSRAIAIVPCLDWDSALALAKAVRHNWKLWASVNRLVEDTGVGN